MSNHAMWEEVEITIPRKRIEWDGETPIITPSKNGVRIFLEDEIGFTKSITDKELNEKFARALANMVILLYPTQKKKALPNGKRN